MLKAALEKIEKELEEFGADYCSVPLEKLGKDTDPGGAISIYVTKSRNEVPVIEAIWNGRCYLIAKAFDYEQWLALSEQERAWKVVQKIVRL